ncbi:GntR family transcriptional regulator [Methylobacterium planeticum]|nr:GntR family transcriptional regulator [Methylobacterium planeticum]
MDVQMPRTTTSKTSGKRAVQRAAKGGAASHAYDVLREQIIRNLAPGSPLDEEVFARLGLSRTPVREALARLAGERLVELSPNRGARVAPVGLTELREHIEGLDVMQRLVTRWAAARRTEEEMELIDKERAVFEDAAAARDGVAMTEANWRFHNAIGAASRNSIFAGCYRQILTEGLRIDRLAMFREAFASTIAYRDHLDRIVADHAEMADALRREDQDRAEASAATHVDTARQRFGDFLTRSTTPAFSIDLQIPAKGGSHV